jgi:Xaa-Pro dipeptidase
VSQGIREQRLREALHAANLDALICRLPENVLLLTGYWPMNGMSFACFPADGEPLLLVPEGERAQAEAGRWRDVRTFGTGGVEHGDPLEAVAAQLRTARGALGIAGAAPRIGYEGSFESVAPPHVSGEGVASSLPTQHMLAAVFGATPADASDLLQTQRAVKTPEEIAGVRRAVAVADMGCAVFREALRPDVRECDMVAAVESAIIMRGVGFEGAHAVRGWATVLAGPASVDAGRPFQLSTTRAIAAGESAVLELGVVVDGYWADLTRTYVAGEPSARQRTIHTVVLAAHDAAIAVLRPGISGSDVDHAAREVVTKAGFGAAFPHQTGHGLGFRYHEDRPLLHPRDARPLAAGMVVTVEPGIYLPGEFGLRIEDDVLVTESGAESLSRAPRELQ